ncbi:MAG: class I SAM-dependent methyltransferase [Rhodospirillales bacterium]
MSRWTDGYVADIGYTHGFYREMAPAHLALATASRGAVPPDCDRPFADCELGCGQGVTSVLLAAQNPHATFHANDFNPTHVGAARRLAAEAGVTNLTLSDASFADYADADLPDFDAVALHGVYSWISAENRAAIRRFLSRRLKVGGVVYLSYNAMPGWTAGAGLRRLFADLAARPEEPTALRIERGMALGERMKAVGAHYFRFNPGSAERLEKMKTFQRNYFAHEFLNRDWTPFYHVDLASELSEAKLTFVASANMLDHVDMLNLTAEQQQLLAEVPDPAVRETLRDYIVNQSFRRDVFVKGPVPMSGPQTQAIWRGMRFALTVPREAVSLSIAGPLGEATLQPETYGPIVDALAETDEAASGGRTVSELMGVPAIRAIGAARLQQALVVMTGAGWIQPCGSAAREAERRAGAAAFNDAVRARALASAEITVQAAAVSGSGVTVDRVGQLFLRALSGNADDPAEYVTRILRAQGEKMVKDGDVLETPEENAAEIARRWADFVAGQLPRLRRIGAFEAPAGAARPTGTMD